MGAGVVQRLAELQSNGGILMLRSRLSVRTGIPLSTSGGAQSCMSF
jgi:hypothetical protein